MSSAEKIHDQLCKLYRQMPEHGRVRMSHELEKILLSKELVRRRSIASKKPKGSAP